MNETVIVPADRADGFVELARTPTGRLFKKHILHEGSFIHPGDPKSKITVDKAMFSKLKENFNAGHCDIVQVPIVDGNNVHVEDPLRNVGEVVDLTYEDGKGVYATIDARDANHAEKLGKTLLGASAMMHLNYTDTKTGNKVGPTLLHVAVTNRPYVTKLEDYKEIVAASADMSHETPVVLMPVVDESAEEQPMELDALLQELKDKHGVDVNALKASAEKADSSAQLVAAMSNVLGAATGTPVVETMSVEDVGRAVVELSQEKVNLAKTVSEQAQALEELKLSALTAKAEAEVDGLVRSGRVLPKQRDAYVKLAVSDRETFTALVPDDSVVQLSELGVTVHDEPPKFETEEQVTEAIKHYETIALSRNGKKQ